MSAYKKNEAKEPKKVSGESRDDCGCGCLPIPKKKKDKKRA